MKTICPIEQEINQIRRQIYEATKDMTPTERTERCIKNTEAIIKKYGFRVVANANEMAIVRVNH